MSYFTPIRFYFSSCTAIFPHVLPYWISPTLQKSGFGQICTAVGNQYWIMAMLTSRSNASLASVASRSDWGGFDLMSSGRRSPKEREVSMPPLTSPNPMDSNSRSGTASGPRSGAASRSKEQVPSWMESKHNNDIMRRSQTGVCPPPRSYFSCERNRMPCFKSNITLFTFCLKQQNRGSLIVRTGHQVTTWDLLSANWKLLLCALVTRFVESIYFWFPDHLFLEFTVIPPPPHPTPSKRSLLTAAHPWVISWTRD